MVIDTSAIIAFLEEEPVSSRLTVALATQPRLHLSAGSLLEAGIVAERRRGADGARRLDLLLASLGASVAPVTLMQAQLARRAFRRFGKGRHPARLNFGDCFSYALATAIREPLLFVGNDFSQTDVAVAPY